MFWADEIAEKVDKSKEQHVDDAFSTSGIAHVGSLRGFVIHDIAHKALIKAGYKATFTFILDDFDPVDELPGKEYSKELIESEMGKPLYFAKSPIEGKSLAQYFGEEIMGSAADAKVFPEFLSNFELYKSGQLNEVIKICLDNTEKIKEIYKRVTGKARPEENWYPFQPICEKCGKVGTTTSISWNGTEVEYICEPEKVEWAKGCGHKGKISPFNGNGKLYWRVEWPARMVALNVTVEGEGKDHWVAGGSRQMADAIIREIFKTSSPVDIRYEFFVAEGKKMSKSKGNGVDAEEIIYILPTELLRYLLAKNPKKEVDFAPYGSTIPLLFDDYDRAMNAFEKKIDFPDLAKAWEIVQEPGFEPGYRMRFSKVALSIQMPKVNIYSEAENEKGNKLTEYETLKLDERIEYAKRWLDKYAPADYVFKIKEAMPKVSLDKEQIDFLEKLLNVFESKTNWDGNDLHQAIHDIKNDAKIEAKKAFGSIYQIFLGKESGPQAGWFLANEDRVFVIKRLNEAIKS